MTTSSLNVSIVSPGFMLPLRKSIRALTKPSDSHNEKRSYLRFFPKIAEIEGPHPFLPRLHLI